MTVLINNIYIDSTRIDFITPLVARTINYAKCYVFYVYMKNRVEPIACSWSLKTYNGETEETLSAKADTIRTRLAQKMSITPIECLDKTIDLKKNDPVTKKPAPKKAAPYR